MASLWACSKILQRQQQQSFLFRRSCLLLSTTSGSKTSQTGTVKFYLRDKGYGFINPDGRDDVDLFVHKSSIDSTLPKSLADQSVRIPYLKKGERVRFLTVTNNGLEQATSVTWLDGKKIPPERTNYLGGVHERAKRNFGETVYTIMEAEGDGMTNEQRLEKIMASFVEARNNIMNAEAYVTRLGMDPSEFPTVKAQGRGRYLFKKEDEILTKKEASLDEATKAEEAATLAGHIAMAAAGASSSSSSTSSKEEQSKEDTSIRDTAASGSTTEEKKEEGEEDVTFVAKATSDSDESPTEESSSSSSSSSSSDDEEEVTFESPESSSDEDEIPSSDDESLSGDEEGEESSSGDEEADDDDEKEKKDDDTEEPTDKPGKP